MWEERDNTGLCPPLSPHQRALQGLSRLKLQKPFVHTAVALLAQRGAWGRGGAQASGRTWSCWQCFLSAGSSVSAHAEIRHVANPAMRCEPRGGGRMELRSLWLCFHPWQHARVLQCPAASVTRGRGFPRGWHHETLAGLFWYHHSIFCCPL